MFSRRIFHHGSDPNGTAVPLDDRALGRCWFELLRQGGCGAGELVLNHGLTDREEIRIGDWISFEAAPGDRWYLGRVEERRFESPAGVHLRLEGMGIELGEVFPGGFGPAADGPAPHRYARSDLFHNDPDWNLETVDSVSQADDFLHRMIPQYVVPATHISYDPNRIESPVHGGYLESLKFRGEESARAIIKDLGLRSQSAWGVDAQGTFYFLKERSNLMATWQEGKDITSLSESMDREFLFNRILLTGDYLYDIQDQSGQMARRSYRWRGNYVQPESRDQYGERRIRIWIPWIRTEQDSIEFSREFFRIYAQPVRRYLIETVPQSSLPVPWEGQVRLLDRAGNELTRSRIASIRVLFDRAAVLRMELGPEDPRDLWPEPSQDERWEIAEQNVGGGALSVTDYSLSSFWWGSSSGASSLASSGQSSQVSSDGSSNGSSGSSLFNSSGTSASGLSSSPPSSASSLDSFSGPSSPGSGTAANSSSPPTSGSLSSNGNTFSNSTGMASSLSGSPGGGNSFSSFNSSELATNSSFQNSSSMSGST